MKKSLLLFLSIIYSTANYALATSNALTDSTEKNTTRYPFLLINYQGGIVLPTNDFVTKQKNNPTFTATTLKFGYSSNGEEWQDYAYGMPYGGVGLYFANFYNDKGAFGSPFALYGFQGMTLNDYSKRLKIKFEWQLGASFNWKPYDPFRNHENTTLGSPTNVFVGFNLYASYPIFYKWDLNFGIGMTHCSNGASRLPNSGVNLFAPFIEMKYNFNYKPFVNGKNRLVPPSIDSRIDYDLLINISSRQRSFDTVGTKLPSEYVDRNFNVYGISMAPMWVNSYKYKYGASIDFLYDESSRAKAWREVNPMDGKLYDRVKLGPFWKRFSMGISAKGELMLPNYSIFANLGYNIIHGHDKDQRLYQVLGVKVFLKDNLFGTFGIRATHFSKAQYLYWSLGYTFQGGSFSKIKKSLPALIKNI